MSVFCECFFFLFFSYIQNARFDYRIRKTTHDFYKTIPAIPVLCFGVEYERVVRRIIGNGTLCERCKASNTKAFRRHQKSQHQNDARNGDAKKKDARSDVATEPVVVGRRDSDYKNNDSDGDDDDDDKDDDDDGDDGSSNESDDRNDGDGARSNGQENSNNGTSSLREDIIISGVDLCTEAVGNVSEIGFLLQKKKKINRY